MTPAEFLSALWQEKPKELFILIWIYPGKRSHWFQDVNAAADFVAASTNLDVYVGVGLAPRDYGPAQRCVSKEVAGLAGFWADFDVWSNAHNKKSLPPTTSDALSIIPQDMPPTLVLSTGNGAHAWWLFKEPLIFDDDDERTETMRVSNRFHSLLRIRCAARGWSYDRLSDFARVLRIAGTQNHKDPAHPKEVKLLASSGRRYDISEFADVLDEMSIPDPEAKAQADAELAERLRGAPLKVDLSARMPDELIDAWAREDMKFRNTWARSRHDLKDQSQSGYDLALACFGFDAGLSEQEIVTLIVHNRAVNNQKARSTVDYFERTLSRALKRTGRSVVVEVPVVAASPVPNLPAKDPQNEHKEPDSPEPPAPSASSDEAKVMLCEAISKALRVKVLRLVKITGKTPQFRMELDGGHKIEFPNVTKLIAQDSVRSAVAAAVGIILPKIKPRDWERLAQLMLDACIIEEGSEELEWEGLARMYLHRYLADTPFIPCIEGQDLQLQRRPMVLEGKISICASDLQGCVNKTATQSYSAVSIAGMLSAIGAKSTRVRGARIKEQSRWILPYPEFDPSEYEALHQESADAHQ